jgi:hypothetical protein
MNIRNDPVMNGARAARESRPDAVFCGDSSMRPMEPGPSAVYISLTRNRIPISFTTMPVRVVVSE